MTRILGVDLGQRRIGLAIADVDAGRAIPLTTLRRGRTAAADAQSIGRIVIEQSVVEIVVGLPFEASGAEGPQAAITLDWVAAIRPLVGVRVTMRDERLTSHVAEGRLGPMKRGRSGGPPTASQRDAYRARVDREAAAIILQDELDTRSAAATGAAASGATAPS